MTVHLDIISQIKIASPCNASWDSMRGDDRVRHCEQCDLDVHNLEEMTRAEVHALLLSANGRVCAQVRRRLDDTIILRDCPVGLAALRARARRSMARAVACASFLFSAAVLYARGSEDPVPEARLTHLQPFKWACERLNPPPTPMPAFRGDFAPTPAQMQAIQQQAAGQGGASR